MEDLVSFEETIELDIIVMVVSVNADMLFVAGDVVTTAFDGAGVPPLVVAEADC